MTPAQIIELVCKTYSVTPKEFRSSRARRVMRCHQIIIIALKRTTKLSDHQVVEILGCDIQRVYHSMNKFRDCNIDSDFYNQYLAIEEYITGNLNILSQSYSFPSSSGLVQHTNQVPVTSLHQVVV